MGKRWIAQLPIALPLPALFWLAACPLWAGPYKCREPDGKISYQQVPCPAESAGAELIPDTRLPSGAATATTAKKYTVEGQLKALESARRKARQGREKAKANLRAEVKPKVFDAARCAKHRAEAARWRREVKNGYRDRDQQEQETQMLKHHEALVERHCAPER